MKDEVYAPPRREIKSLSQSKLEFVLFIEPLLNLLKAKLQNYGLRSESTVISFADDCTGLLSDLKHTNFFLNQVEDFCVASEMRLNKDKTVIRSLHPWSTENEPLRQSLTKLGVIVVGNIRRAKLLSILYGPTHSDADRLQH
ncbi:hypothetical protein Plhal304r1_c019g0069791 [Plasmopara halstedii]